MADSKIFHLRGGVTIEKIGREVERFLRDGKQMTVEGISSPDGYLVQAKESSTWKNVTGLGQALQVQIMPSGEDVLVKSQPMPRLRRIRVGRHEVLPRMRCVDGRFA